MLTSCSLMDYRICGSSISTFIGLLLCTTPITQPLKSNEQELKSKNINGKFHPTSFKWSKYTSIINIFFFTGIRNISSTENNEVFGKPNNISNGLDFSFHFAYTEKAIEKHISILTAASHDENLMCVT